MRLRAAVEVFNELGGMAELEVCDGHSCASSSEAIEQSTEDGPLPYSNYIIQKVVDAIIDNATKLLYSLYSCMCNETQNNYMITRKVVSI